MNEPDSERAESVRVIADILAAAYLRLRVPESLPPAVDCAETKSESCEEWLTP